MNIVDIQVEKTRCPERDTEVEITHLSSFTIE